MRQEDYSFQHYSFACFRCTVEQIDFIPFLLCYLELAIGGLSQKRLKINEYMQRGILQALNPLSNHVTFTAIVPGA